MHLLILTFPKTNAIIEATPKEDIFMHKISVPIHIQTIDENSINGYIAECKRTGADRVFICDSTPIFSASCLLTNDKNRMTMSISAFKNAGFEVGIWISGFGHGVVLSHDLFAEEKFGFTEMEGVLGDKFGYAYCPTDENYTKAYANSVKKIAEFSPDLIMLDDDFRINCRRYYFGCFCENHLKDFYNRIGEVIPRSEIEEKIFTGEKNKYRSAYMQMMSDTLLGFARKLRCELDTVNPEIRLGMCCPDENWDFNGTDCIAIAKAFAGNTKPFMRSCAAPYWNQSRLSKAIDISRAQGFWTKDCGVEVFAEGDTYPRPRYRCPSKLLELFDLAVLADGNLSGDLKYMFDYIQPWDYEKGYVDRHEHNASVRAATEKAFNGKKRIGVRIAYNMHVFENAVFPETLSKNIARTATVMTTGQPQRILSDNCIPTVFEDTGYPIYISGENARYITETDLLNGAILDLPAAIILKERGFDVGLESYETADCHGEHFLPENDSIIGMGAEPVLGIESKAFLYKIEANKNANILSTFSPYDTAGSYLYENSKSQRFYVLAFDASKTEDEQYLLSYYRQKHLISSVEWLCGKVLPVICTKNPRLYTICAEKDGKMSVSLFNISVDEIINPVIKLDKTYTKINSTGVIGTVDKNTVTLSEIPPYGYALFEIE